jgi:hypothetical protein
MTEFVDPQWNKQYAKLTEFKRKNGHCLVPRGYMEDMSLGKWVDKQRQSHSKNKLQLDRKDLLEDIGFVWNVENHQWHLQYQKLVAFKRKNGNCHVPSTYQKDPSFGTWVSWQRNFHRQNRLRLDRKNLLEELGFDSRVGNSAAPSGKKQYGNFLVPNYKYEEDASLGVWVSNQQQSHCNNKFRLDRKDLLDEIGFESAVVLVAIKNKASPALGNQTGVTLEGRSETTPHCCYGRFV